ncbi:glutamine amidotransferase [Klebsiella pneumoniae]|nr:glutamine amidotransferase [Klebsiella pneumoniae]
MHQANCWRPWPVPVIPLLAVREYQQGRSLVWTSDMSAYWLPEEFAKWPGYRQLLD